MDREKLRTEAFLMLDAEYVRRDRIIDGPTREIMIDLMMAFAEKKLAEHVAEAEPK